MLLCLHIFMRVCKKLCYTSPFYVIFPCQMWRASPSIYVVLLIRSFVVIRNEYYCDLCELITFFLRGIDIIYSMHVWCKAFLYDKLTSIFPFCWAFKFQNLLGVCPTLILLQYQTIKHHILPQRAWKNMGLLVLE